MTVVYIWDFEDPDWYINEAVDYFLQSFISTVTVMIKMYTLLAMFSRWQKLFFIMIKLIIFLTYIILL